MADQGAKAIKRFKLFTIVTGTISGLFLSHKYLSKYKPSTVRNVYFDKYFKEEKQYNKMIKKVLYRYMMKFGLIPRANIKIDDEDMLKTQLLGMRLKYPIGLGPGIDNLGNCITNLEKLGYEYVEIGPLTEELEDIKTFDKSKDKRIIEYKDDERSIHLLRHIPSNSVDYALSIIQQEFYKIDKNLNIGFNLKPSMRAASTSPYLTDNLFLSMIDSALNISDVITVNLSSYQIKTMLQYKNKQKFEQFLSKIKKTIIREFGVKAALEYELTNIPKEKQFSVSNFINIPSQILSKTRAKILIRLDTELTEDEIKNYIESIKGSGIVDGIVIGGMKKVSNTFITGEKAREDSLKLLKIAYKYTQGQIPIISTGGILTGDDVYERLLNGAEMVLLYSAFLIRGPYCLEIIVKELQDRMHKEGKKSIKEINRA